MMNSNNGSLEIAEEKGLQDVKVFRVCECDAVAAYSQEEAISWYKELTGLSDDELYDYEEVEVMSLDGEHWDDEERTRKRTLKSVVEEYWNGEPFIALSWDS
jgi:hypothetical protein